MDRVRNKVNWSKSCIIISSTHLLLITVLSVTLYGRLFCKSTSRRQVYSPPSLTPTSSRTNGPSGLLEFGGLGINTVRFTTPSLNHETFTSRVSWLPRSVMLQRIEASISCSRSLTSETTTLGISFTKRKQQKLSLLLSTNKKALHVFSLQSFTAVLPLRIFTCL